jgi:Transposase DDE domain
MSDFAVETLKRLPLAEASYRLLDYVTQADFLADVFQRHHGASYEQEISFPLFVQLIAAALLEHQGSGHKSFARAQADGILEASLKAMYGKLARVPLSLSQGLLSDATPRLLDVCPATAGVPMPPCLRGFHVLALDGKKIKHVTHRLKILRHVRGQVLAAKVLVALDLARGLAVGLTADPDGEAADSVLVPELLAQVRTRLPGPRLWVADRAFCDLNQPHRLAEGGDHFVIRYHAKVGFHRDPQRPVRTGVDRQGRAYQEEWGWLGSARDPRRLSVRRLTLQRPGDEAVIVVTDLLDADLYPAEDLLDVYLQRWGIERVFQRITEVFHLRRLIGSTPQAGVFQTAFCLLLYNILVVVRGYVSAGQERLPETVSLENLFDDVQRQLVALHEVLSPPEVVALFSVPPRAQTLQEQLRALLGAQGTDYWAKAPTRWHEPIEKPARSYLPGGHTSVYRLLQAACQEGNKVEPHNRN